jgi:Mrp family chromosome partitioning ATPase
MTGERYQGQKTMSRMLAALKQLEARSSELPLTPESAPPDRPTVRSQPSAQVPQGEAEAGQSGGAGADQAIEAALARVEMAAAGLREHEEEPCGDSSAAPWPILPTPQHAPAYRQLAENIISQVASCGPAVLLFTSPGDGEGKTELLASLAAALAQRTPQGVLLVDANWRKPDLAAYLGIPAWRGLAHVLAGVAQWQQVVQETSVPHLDLLPGVMSPTPDVGPPDRWDLRPLLTELRSRYGLVLLDAASLAHIEAAALAGCCDGVYLVVRLRHTTRRRLAQAVEVLRACRGRLLGGVVIGC